jgi:FdhD protein
MTTEAARKSTASLTVVSVRDGHSRTRLDTLATEEPLEIRAAGPGQEQVRVAVTMRTPGHDFELAAGFLVTEGLVDPDGVRAVAYCEDLDVQEYNVLTVQTRAPFALGVAERNFFATSSCGICGKAAIEAIRVRCEPITAAVRITGETVLRLPKLMRGRQRLFGRTGGLHAAGLFTADGDLRVLREDVGRHNAVDKVVGALELGTAAVTHGDVLLVSGRLSFEIVQKAAVARIPVVCAVSAPSSLAVDVADSLGITVIGFVRPGGFNVYAHPERVHV